MKLQSELFAQGEVIAKSWNLDFLPLDVRSKGGTKVQNELARSAKLYRQNYCGCLFALKAQRDKSQKKRARVALVLKRTTRNKESPRVAIP